jgi:hypothetical protein
VVDFEYQPKNFGRIRMKRVVISTKVDRQKERPLVTVAASLAGVSVSAFVRAAVMDATRARLAELARAPAVAEMERERDR